MVCARCPRLRTYCRRVAREKKPQFRDETYWGRPVPGFGDPRARILIVGLAPAAHGANRTGRMFTGDGTDGAGSSDFLARALHRARCANQPTSRHRRDGLILRGVYLTAIVRCAPPANKPLPGEIARCAPYLEREMDLLKDLCVIVALGKIAFDQTLSLLSRRGASLPGPRPAFGHGVRVAWGAGFPIVLGSYHPSRQNTQTGRLTPAMFDAIFREAKERAKERAKKTGGF